MRSILITQINAKARQLDIEPKVLLFALACVREKWDEIETIKKCIASVEDNIMEQCERQTLSKKQSVRQAGEYGLQDIRRPGPEYDETLISRTTGIMSFSNYFDAAKPIKVYQYFAWDIVRKDVEKIIKQYSIDERKPDDFFSIIESICEDELIALKGFADLSK